MYEIKYITHDGKDAIECYESWDEILINGFTAGPWMILFGLIICICTPFLAMRAVICPTCAGLKGIKK